MTISRRKKKERKQKAKNLPIEGEYKGIKYFSCLELAYILRSESKGHSIKNFDLDPLPYQVNKKAHLYYPDFIVDDNLIVEIKGLIIPRNREKILQKRIALEEFCKLNSFSCSFVTKDQISKHFIQKAKKFHERAKNA